MGALAEKRWEDEDVLSAPAATEVARPVRPLDALKGDESPESSPRWNVLAEELVSFPPKHQQIWLEPAPRPEERSRAYADAWLERELDLLARRRRRSLEAGRHLVLPGSSLLEPEPQSAPLAVPRRSAASSRPLRRAHKRPAVSARPAGLRRLLPGVATLAVLAGAWFGVGSIASAAHRGPIVRLPGSVAVHGGYAYVARPGDTLWSIAASIEPGRDPRPLVDKLASQIGSDTLQPGETLLLPR